MAAFVACDTAKQEVSPIVEPNASYPVISGLTLQNTGGVTEGDTIVFKLTIDKPIDRSLTFTPVINTLSTTAEDHVEYDIEGPAIIDPWKTEAEFIIYTYQDVDFEEADVISFTFEVNGIAERHLLHPDNVFPTGNVTINNYTSDDLVMEMYWDTDVDLGFGVYGAGANTDFDFMLSTAASFDVADAWSSDVVAAAWTADHPEVITVAPGDFDDGDYIGWSDMYENAFAGYGVNTPIPITVKAYKPGTQFNYTFDQNPANVFDADAATGVNEILINLTVAGSTFTVTNWDGSVTHTGTMPTNKSINNTPRPVVFGEKPPRSKSLLK